jgi:FkbM family methyltransferase
MLELPLAPFSLSAYGLDPRNQMIKSTYLFLLRFGPIRRGLRRVRARAQSVSGYSDPFFDLGRIARESKATLFLDIGCHHGDTLLRFIESGISCPVAAFDPFADNIMRAKTQLSRFPWITFHEIALSNANGTAAFHLNRNEQTSSLLENDSGNISSFGEDTAVLKTCDVTTQTLDSWAKENGAQGPCVIKCDTQGAEGRVIEGGKSFIRNHCVAFYGEVMLGDMYKGQASFGEIRRLLEKDCGMVLTNIYPCLRDKVGRAVQMDALWVKAQSLPLMD